MLLDLCETDTLSELGISSKLHQSKIRAELRKFSSVEADQPTSSHLSDVGMDNVQCFEWHQQLLTTARPNHFMLETRMVEGGSACVYTAADRVLGKKVVLKFVAFDDPK